MRIRFFAVAAALIAEPASAEVVGASAHGFHLRQSITLAGSREAAFAAFGKIGRWWSSGHTYSGDARRLSLELKAGGCFCETLANGGVEHLRVAHVDRPKRIVLTGGLGPLLYQGVAAVMDVQFAPEGTGTKVTVEYKAAGFASGGADKLAPLVDGVLGEQVKRFGAAAARP